MAEPPSFEPLCHPGSVQSDRASAPRRDRRTFLADVGMGFTGLALGAMLARDGVIRGNDLRVWQSPDGVPHFEPRAKRVIWIFLVGGMSHVESFDPKPALSEHAGKTRSEE